MGQGFSDKSIKTLTERRSPHPRSEPRTHATLIQIRAPMSHPGIGLQLLEIRRIFDVTLD
jgi:hypothetical protein